jgi:hypothetical protein
LDNKLFIPRRLDDGNLVICGVQRQIIKCLALSALDKNNAGSLRHFHPSRFAK